jgi:nitrate/nitrite transporter NarK
MACLGTSLWSLAGAVIATAAILGFLPLFWAIIPRFLSGTPAAGGFAFVNSLSAVGGFVGPIVFGWAASKTGGYSGGLWIFSGVALASGAIWLLSGRLGTAGFQTIKPGSRAAADGEGP